MTSLEKSSADTGLAWAVEIEQQRFKECYLWLKEHMPPRFFNDMTPDRLMLVVHHLMGFHLQDYFSVINLKRLAIVLCLNEPDSDIRILHNYREYGVKSYAAFVSVLPPPIAGVNSLLRIAVIYFTEAVETVEQPLPLNFVEDLRQRLVKRLPALDDQAFQALIAGMNTRFLRALPFDQLLVAVDMLLRAKQDDHCQYEIKYNQKWKEQELPSLQIVLAWRNVPKGNFLYRVARMVRRHGLVMQCVNATYHNPYGRQNVLLLSLGLNGTNERAAWEAADIDDFVKELITLKYFELPKELEAVFVEKKLLTGNEGFLLKAILELVHQLLVPIDANLYTLGHIEEALCRCPEITVKLCALFKYKFDPEHLSPTAYARLKAEFLQLVEKLDTGHEHRDQMRKNVLRQALQCIEHLLKTNFYCKNKIGFCFRLDPLLLQQLPYDYTQFFPVLPYAIFYMSGMRYIGFHVRFKDLARGGLRTILPEHVEQANLERNNIFLECYQLALTQNRKNKDIPEGGAKGIIFLEPQMGLHVECQILERELSVSNIAREAIQEKIAAFRQDQREEYIRQAQRSFVNALLTLVNCTPEGELRADQVVDYWKRAEYLYLGPDERMSDDMLHWISDYSKQCGYRPGRAFISSKPGVGINHKEYGVTSLGVNVYVKEVLKFLGIAEGQPFTVKMTGGPDGDVAGNQICNLQRTFPKTARLIALTDVSGTIYDPKGLDLDLLVGMFKQGQPIRDYPPHMLSEGGFLLDRFTKRAQEEYTQQTLLWRKRSGDLSEEWLSTSDMNAIYRRFVHSVEADIFIPGGGRPRSVHEGNWEEFLTSTGQNSARAIVEGANLYFTPQARRKLEERGILIIKDSSANKCGVICSSFEVLSGLLLSDEEFMQHKARLVHEIQQILEARALDEAKLLLESFKRTGLPLTQLSDALSEKINHFTDQLLHDLEGRKLEKKASDPFMRCYLNYCPPVLRQYEERLIHEIPEAHQKSIIASHLAARLVYRRGVDWAPSLVDILPLLLEDYS